MKYKPIKMTSYQCMCARLKNTAGQSFPMSAQPQAGTKVEDDGMYSMHNN